MPLKLPFDPIERGREVEDLVMKGNKRSYYKFRAARYYGGIATADAMGCSFLCAFCWNYNRNLHPGRTGTFCTPGEVASKLVSIVTKSSFRLYRITGCEPILGRRSLDHLVEVIGTVLKKDPGSEFVIETNGLMLGYAPEMITRLKFPGLMVRVALKGVDEGSFERVSGARKEFFRYPIEAVRLMQQEGIRAGAAVMGAIFTEAQINKLDETLRKAGIKGELEIEFLESYPHVTANLKKRGIEVVGA